MTKYHPLQSTPFQNLSRRYLFFVTLVTGLLVGGSSWAQDPTRFEKDLGHYLNGPTIEHSGDLIIFTGSSSIRMWSGLKTDFPGYNVVNRGFGGSQTSDLLAYLNALVIRHKPAVVFIYEGDNDIAAREKPDQIMQEVRQVVAMIRSELPATKIVFISAKPSILRWGLLAEYLQFNHELKNYAASESGVYFVDVWQPMLNQDNSLNTNLFISDGLHMNLNGYVIWTRTIAPLLDELAIK